MSITENMQSTALPAKVPAKQLPRPSHHRIRRGQKLDEIVSLSEQRLSCFASGSFESKSSTSNANFSPTSSSSSSSSSLSAPGPAASLSHAGGDSPFQLQEYLALLVRHDPHNVEAITSLPTEADIDSLNADKGKRKDEPEDDGLFQNVDTDVWVYEQLRRLVLDLSTPWLTSLQQECDKYARPQTCAAMNAGGWMYLCASHGEEKQCCVSIDLRPPDCPDTRFSKGAPSSEPAAPLSLVLAGELKRKGVAAPIARPGVCRFELPLTGLRVVVVAGADESCQPLDCAVGI